MRGGLTLCAAIGPSHSLDSESFAALTISRGGLDLVLLKKKAIGEATLVETVRRPA
jgi:hypothetical protein